MIIKFELPYNGDDSIFSIYKDYSEFVYSVYGKAHDCYPEGRNIITNNKISFSKIENIVKKLDNIGISFNYVLNGINHSNQEYDREYREKFINFTKKVKNIGCKTITLGNIFLIELIKNEVPGIDINASVMLEIDNLTRLKNIESFGIKRVVLSKTLLKNFFALKNIYKYSNSKMQLVLLANDPCLHHCAFTQYHNQTLSCATGQGYDYINYCRLHCNNAFAADYRKIISASFIRPEDIELYGNIGYRLFKLTDRKQSTNWIKHAVAAYVQRRYDGNLADIMSPWSQYTQLAQEKQDSRSEIRIKPYINNRSLDNYLDFWKNKKIWLCERRLRYL